MADVTKGMWSEDYIDTLPDDSFLWIQEGGEKDDDWRTIPRSLRHWPVRDADWQLDMERLRAALPEIVEAPEQILPLTMKPAVLIKASRMMLREIEIEAPKAGMTPDVASMIGDLVAVLQATAALAPAPPEGMDQPDAAAPGAGAPAPGEAPAAAPVEQSKDAETAKADDDDAEPTEKADGEDGWAEFEKRRAEAGTRDEILKRKPVIRR